MIAKIIFLFSFITFSLFAQTGGSPYPIIFVHGLNSNDYTWDTTINELNGIWGTYTRNNVFYAVLNAYGGMTNIAGNDGTVGNFDDDVIVSFTNETNELPNANLYTINFDNYWNQYDQTLLPYSPDKPVGDESKSNQAAIYKQGYAVKKMIEAVLQATGAKKVILVGHSMGGLAIREYMQRTENGLPTGTHTWWIDPTIPFGHKIAKVVTFGTPHGGSNLWNIPLPIIPNEDSEAVRDLRYEYLTLFSKPPDPNTDNGVYLFGGDENFIDMILQGFHNYDINCDGDSQDFITGITSWTNHGNGYLCIANMNMPLPTNVEYTWITSDNGDPGQGDGVVRRDRQFILGNGDTLLTNVDHTDEPSDFITILRALDEPNNYELAYEIQFDNPIAGLITFQTNYTPFDIDYFKIEIPVAGDFSVTLSGDNNILEQLVVLDDTQTILDFRTSFPSIINLQLSTGTYYIFVTGSATSDSWQNPYTLAVDFSEGVAPPSPVLLIPTDGANNVSQSPTLDWESTSVGDSYNLQVSTNPSFSNLIVNENDIHFSDYFLSGLELNTTYYWRVSATNNWGTSAWSIDYNFTTSAIPNTVIVNGTISNNTLWTSNNLYWVQGGLVGLTINEGVTLEIEPGTIIKFDISDLSNYNRIVIRGNLIADGTPDKKIVFTSIRDDSYGEDTNNDG
ncbi:MAG: alpha/beta fold hydrolase, partial [Ignavibacteria bacterium]|nr:alpha/beta fold hydrolase [Ignavibacteria bacterium]